jgi:hypothetical protein
VLLIRDHLDRRYSTAQIASDRRRLIRLSGLSAAALSRLKQVGLISRRADVSATYRRFLSWAPRPADVMLSSLLSL